MSLWNNNKNKKWLENSTVVTPIIWNMLETDGLEEMQRCLLTVMLSRNEGFSSVQFSSVQLLSHVWLSVTHGLQHTRPPCPSPTPAAYSNSCPLSRWCHPTISSSVVPFFSHLQSCPASRSFQMSQFFTSGGQIGASPSASVLPMNIQDWFPLGWTSLTSLQSKGLSRKSLLQHHSSKASVLWHSAFFIVQLSHLYMTTGKTTALIIRTFVGKVITVSMEDPNKTKRKLNEVWNRTGPSPVGEQ